MNINQNRDDLIALFSTFAHANSEKITDNEASDFFEKLLEDKDYDDVAWMLLYMVMWGVAITEDLARAHAKDFEEVLQTMLLAKAKYAADHD